MKIGIGYDVHKLVPDRKLVVGGVEIPFDKGSLGHSDADVLLHAICDALLGAAKLGDIGKHFPDTDPAYKYIDSRKLLRKVKDLVDSEGYQIEDVDSVIIAQEPKMSPYIDEMRHNIASDLGVKADNVGVKATTTEGLGFEGKTQGIAAQAVCLVK